MISYRLNAAMQIVPVEEPEPVCGRCNGTGEEQWAGKYRPRNGPEMGPCLRCRPLHFMAEIDGRCFGVA